MFHVIGQNIRVVNKEGKQFRIIKVEEKFLSGEAEILIDTNGTQIEELKDFSELAEKVYEMCEDMDYQDYAEEKETEINKIAMQLRMLTEFGCNELLKALEIITRTEE